MFSFFKKNKLNKVESKTDLPDSDSGRFNFLNVGFHGDEYLLRVVDILAKNVDLFVETGSNVGSTLSFFSKKYPAIHCLSCEPDKDAFALMQKNTGTSNVEGFNELSQDFIERLKSRGQELHNKKALFWLDAHGYGFQWPLIDELNYIIENFASYYILIDDFEVPGIPEFGFDEYEDQICSFDYVKPHLVDLNFHLYYPTYKEKTSNFHPLRGWGLITSKKIDIEQHGLDFVREEKFVW